MSRTATKHQIIVRTLQERIAAGSFRPGDRIPSDSDLVREFGVSRPTIAKAVVELEKSGLVRRRRGAGTYVEEREEKSRLFGLLIPGLGQTEIFEPICAEIARSAQQDQHSLLWGSSQGASPAPDGQRGTHALQLCHQLIRQQVAGVFFAPLELVRDKDLVNQQIVDLLRGAGIPVVLLDRDLRPYPERSGLDLVGIDNRRAGWTVANHFIERGAKRPVFFARPGSAGTVDARAGGFLDAIRAAGRPADADAFCRCDPRDAADVEAFLRRAEPDAIACGNDATAAHLLNSLDALGIRVPRDLLVAGFDDVRYAELLRVPLTTIHQPCGPLGREAYRVMLDRINQPAAPARDILLNCELVIRASTTPQPAEQA